MGSAIIGDCEKEDIVSDADFNYFDAHFMQKYLGPARAAAMSATTIPGKTYADDGDDDSDSTEFGPDIDKDALTNKKPNLKNSSF